LKHPFILFFLSCLLMFRILFRFMILLHFSPSRRILHSIYFVCWFTRFFSLSFNSCLILLWHLFFSHHLHFILSLMHFFFNPFSSLFFFWLSRIEKILVFLISHFSFLISHINKSRFIDDIQISIKSLHFAQKIWRDCFSNQNPNSLSKIRKDNLLSRMSPPNSACINLNSKNLHAPFVELNLSFQSQNGNPTDFLTHNKPPALKYRFHNLIDLHFGNIRWENAPSSYEFWNQIKNISISNEKWNHKWEIWDDIFEDEWNEWWFEKNESWFWL
jgi:hypothetical protein